MERTLNHAFDEDTAPVKGSAIRFRQETLPETFTEEEDGDATSSEISIDTVIALTARLAQVLAEEADLLADMRVGEIGRLQKEKLQLLEALEAQKRLIDRNPECMEDLSDDECLELAQIIEIFQTVMKENHRRLLIAREVNRKVVEAISDAVQEAAQNGLYDRHGHPEKGAASLSMSLNQTI